MCEPANGDAANLDNVQRLLGISDAQLAEIFGVELAATEQWRARGVPDDYRSRLADVTATVAFLEHKLHEGSLPHFATTPSEVNGETLLQRLARDPAAARATYEAAFDMSAGA